MAAITIEDGLDYSAPLIGIKYQQGLQFLFDHGGITGSYADVEWNGLFFRAVKTATNVTANVDRYQIDMTEIITATKALPPFEITVDGLVQQATYIIHGRNASGTSIANSATITVYICGAIINLRNNLYSIWEDGFESHIYHCGKFTEFDKNTNQYILTENSNLTDDNHTYQYQSGEQIAWINRDGGWSFWNFRKITENYEAKKTIDVNNWQLKNIDMACKSYMLETELNRIIMFDTIAIDATHYKRLTEIGSSDRVIYNGIACKVKDYSKDTSECRQNLNYKLTLEIEENA